MKKVLVLVLALAMIGVGCTTAWVSTLDSILAAAAPALINILEIVSVSNNKPIDTAQVAKITTDAAAIKSLAADFAKASSVAGPGLCQQLNAAVSSYQADENLVLQVAQVSDSNTQSKILLLSTLVAGTVEAVTAVIPACSAPSATFSTAIAFKGAPALKLNSFITTYNTILKAKTGNPAVDALTPTLTLHQHSKFVRVITFGRLN